jgi:hypothetical protein
MESPLLYLANKATCDIPIPQVVVENKENGNHRLDIKYNTAKT